MNPIVEGIIFIIGLGILGAAAYYVGAYMQSKKQTTGKHNNSRPDIDAECDYFAKNTKIGVTIRTGQNKVKIDEAVISFVIEGTVIDSRPNRNIINAGAVHFERRPFSSENDKALLDEVTIRCENIQPKAQTGGIIEFEPKKDQPIIDAPILVKWFWTHEGETKQEAKTIQKRYAK